MSAGELNCLFGLTAAVVIAFAGALRASEVEYDREPIEYTKSVPANRVSELQHRLETGAVDIRFDEEFGWLKALLDELDVPQSSQMLVFSKTSLQRHRISARRPRALYFNDDVYVGYCQNGEVLELTAVDPQLGAVFYTVDQTDETQMRITRQGENCLICHASSSHTRGYPGHVVRSVYADAGGFPVFAAGTYRTDQTSPLEQRWGGWYVTGRHGAQKHLGNLIVLDKQNAEESDNSAGMNVTDLSDRFKTSAYLTPYSDIVALMVMEHQTAMHNRITRANFLVRHAVWYEGILDEALKKSEDDGLNESTKRRVEYACEPLIEYMLFSEEAKLTDKIEGSSPFAAEFAKQGIRDKQGRSLREFDLRTRMFRYPCSYLVYSEAFDGLPDLAKDYIARRLGEILHAEEPGEKYSHLSAADRRAIAEILRETKPALTSSWPASE